MIEWLMLLGIGFLAGSLAMLAFVPVVHQRAVRLTMRNLVEATPLAMTEIRAEKDHLRAQFAMAVRRLEVNVEDMKTKGASQLAEIARKHAEIGGLKAELEKRAAMILTLRARWQLRHAMVRRIVKLLLYLFVRSDRRRRTFFAPRPAATPLHAAPGVVDREAA
ncbi:MAG TPA: hypothetical protein VMF12_09330 [Xanthobacteraceae bacterium]|nr:hypothetical protein [Xanthobacteraceae bacterium]